MLENGWKRPISLLLMLAMFSGFTFLDDVARRVEEGNRLFGREEFDAALEAYRSAQTDRPDSPELHYNVGDALYKQGAVDEAMAAFQKAVETGDPRLGANAFYNIGNALYKKQAFDQAVAAYEKSLELNPSDLDAKINLEMALEKMQEQQKQNDQDKSGENKDNDKKNEDSESDDSKSGEDQEKEEQNQNEQDEEQENQDQKEQDGKNQDSENQDQQEPQDQQKPQDQQQQDGQQQPGELSPEEAERLLDALKDREAESQKRRRIRLQGKRYRGNPW